MATNKTRTTRPVRYVSVAVTKDVLDQIREVAKANRRSMAQESAVLLEFALASIASYRKS